MPSHLQSLSSSDIYVKNKTFCMQSVAKSYYYREKWYVAEVYQNKTSLTNPPFHGPVLVSMVVLVLFMIM